MPVGLGEIFIFLRLRNRFKYGTSGAKIVIFITNKTVRVSFGKHSEIFNSDVFRLRLPPSDES